MVDVDVGRTDDGTIRIVGTPGTHRPVHRPVFAQAVLDVAGTVLVWPDVADLGLPTAEVHDVGRAQQWLWAVYGEHVAAAVNACAAGDVDDALVVAEATALAGSATRLAFGHWAARWWPASYLDQIPALEPDLLGLELAALTYQCQQLFDLAGDQPDDCVAELIDEHEAAIEKLIQWWHALPVHAATARSVEAVLRLIDAAADNAGLDGTALRHLRSSLDQPRQGAATVDVGALFSRRRDFALAAGDALTATGRVIARGTGVNDWRRYPPGLVDAAEDAVSWIVRAVGARRQIEVSVLAGVAAPAAGASLVAEFRVDGGAPGRVRLGSGGDVWTGRADLEAPAAEEVHADVLLPGFDPGAGDDVRVDREAIRDVARRRLTTAALPTPLGSPAGPFLAETVATAAGEDF